MSTCTGHSDLAGLATEAEVERLVDGLALEAFLAQRAGQHLPEQPRAAAGGVLLFAGGAVAGAHDAAVGLAAGAHAHAALGGAFQRAVVVGESEVRLPGLASPSGRRAGHSESDAVAQVFRGIVDAHRVRQLAGIHAVVRIPEGLEFAEGLHELGPEHLGQQRRAGLAVAVLAAERPAEAENHDRRRGR